MSSSVILSILALYTAGFIFIFTGFIILKKFKKDKSERYFAYALIFMGLILGPLMGTRTIFGILGYHRIDLAIAAFDQLILVLSLTCFGFYFSFKLFSGKAKKISLAFFVLLGFFVLAGLVWAFGVEAYTGPHISKWRTEYEPIGKAKIVFIIAWLSIVLFNLGFLSRRLIDWYKTRKLKYDFYIGLTLFVFFLFFIFEELGQMNTWRLVFSRVTSNAIAVVFYLLYTKESFKE